MNIFLHHQTAGSVRRITLTASLALLCFSGNASAESNEVQELRLEVEMLKKEVEMLKKRVQTLESTQPVKALKASKTPTAPKAKTRKITGNPWHALRVNISKAEVISLLGKPGKIHKWKTGEAWYYPNIKGGEVDFDANDKVSGWLEP